MSMRIELSNVVKSRVNNFSLSSESLIDMVIDSVKMLNCTYSFHTQTLHV